MLIVYDDKIKLYFRIAVQSNFSNAWHIEQIDIPEKKTVIKCILFRDNCK